MKRRLWDLGIPALILVAIAAAIAPGARAELRTQQTVAMVRAGQFAALDRYYAAVQAGYDA